MVDRTHIQVFVSCPGDVEPQKQTIRSICDSLNSANDGFQNFFLQVKDWRAFVGQYGIRNQEQVNDFIGVYDIYIGILWKRFGTKTGLVNEASGQDFESGTEEEFNIAKQRWDEFQSPEIHFFFRTDSRDSKTQAESEQLAKVFGFLESQKRLNNHFVNEFASDNEFVSKVLFILSRKLNNVLREVNVSQKQEILTKEPFSKFKITRLNIEPPTGYVERFLIQFSSADDQSIKSRSIHLVDLFRSKHRIVILGDAGSGKSTELRNLAFKLNNEDSDYFPIFQNLNTYTPELGLENFLPEFWSEVPKNLLVVMWDGLDEIQPQDFNSVVRQINRFADKHKEIKILITCRTNFYEIPTENSAGTLSSFESYFIADFDKSDVKEYFDIKYGRENSNHFLAEIATHQFTDLAAKPFFLLVLADIYRANKSLSASRKQIFEAFILSRIVLDEKHYQGTFDLRIKKEEILRLLGRTALVMEMLSRNYIHESEILHVLTIEQFTTLKYCTAFKKKEDRENVWQFEHNNVQEYLAAKELSLQTFEKVIALITFEPEHQKLVPTWINTLTFLFSIIDNESLLFSQLVSWLVENEKEVIVKFEKDKIPKPLRNELFRSIFNHYKQYDIWISSNKFTPEELAQFSQSKETLQLLLSEITSPESSRTTKLNAINILGHFYLATEEKSSIESVLLQLMIDNPKDNYLIFSVIHSLGDAGFTSKDIIAKLMNIVGKRRNQYVRASIYSILLKSHSVEEYIEYLVEGLTIWGVSGDDRDDVSLMDETYHLGRAITAIRSSEALKRLLEYIGNSERLDYLHRDLDLLRQIVDNATHAYKADPQIYDSILKILLNEIKHFRDGRIDLILHFFDKTSTRYKAFLEILERSESVDHTRRFTLAKLASEREIDLIITRYKSHDLTNVDLRQFYLDMVWVGNPNAQALLSIINEQTGLKIEPPPVIDYETIKQSKLKRDFDLLFDKTRFREEVSIIFEDLGKEEITFDDLYHIRKNNSGHVELEDRYAGTALRLIRDFSTGGSSVKKERVFSLLNDDHKVDWYLISSIYEYLSNNSGLVLTQEQEIWIKEWTVANIMDIDFKNALTVTEEGSFSIKRKAIYVSYFSKKLQIPHSKRLILDMLSFDYFEGHQWVGIDHLLSQLTEEEASARISENLINGIKSDAVFKNHMLYAIANNFIDMYPLILKEFINPNRNEATRAEWLRIYFSKTEDTEGLVNLLPNADLPFKWKIVEILVDSGINGRIEQYLLTLAKNITSPNESFHVSRNLIKLQNIVGLDLLVNEIRQGDGHLPFGHNLNYLIEKRAVPKLMELLEISYQKTVTNNQLETLHSAVLAALRNIALRSEDNFITVKTCIKEFMAANSSTYTNVSQLQPFTENLESQFYMNKAHEYNIHEVVAKLKLLDQE